ncbi:UTP-glucose-1-phosphate uridylyltransferase [Aureococcus anophagefferens]|nr:UTP-glucose-1-phosphate uridylyltransferase [Aureococcus anophagefferens]
MLRAALSLWACAAFAVDDGWFASLRWPPQREQATLNNSHAHHAALLAELRRSLGAFEPAASRSDAKDLLRRALRDPRHRDHVVLVLDGRIFTSKAFAHVSKNAMHLRMLAAAIRRHEPLPNVLMLHDSASDGNCHRTKEGRTLATTVIAKKGGYGQCGVLVPNPYYGRGDTADEWAWFVSELKGRAAKIPLERKRPVAFWRGTLGNHKELCAGDVCTPQNCARDDGNYARFQAMALTVSRPDAFDVKCHKFHPRNASDCAAELPLLWDAGFVEWYYPALRHGATHAAVNASTAPGVVDFLEARPWAFVKLVAGAAAVQDELLSPAALSRYVRAVVDALRAHGRQHVHLDDENATAELLRKVDCHGLVETTVWPHRGSKDHWVDNRLRKIKSCDDLVEAVRNSNGRGQGGRAIVTRPGPSLYSCTMGGDFAPYEAKMRADGLGDAAVAAFKNSYEALCSGATGMIPEAELTPAASVPSLDAMADPGAVDPALLAKTVVLKLNGGLGTSMGLDYAKSLLLVKGKDTFLDLTAKQIMGMREKLKSQVKFVLMNSFATSEDTMNFFKAKYPALYADPNLEFVQNKCPDDDEAAFQDINKHKYFNTNNLWIDLEALKATMDASGGLVPLPMIKNKKTVDPKDDASTPCFQLETAMGAAIECFKGAAAIVVPRTRFAPVKKCNDLLTLRSDAYATVDDVPVLAPGVAAAPTVDLDSKKYKLVQQLEANLLEGGCPSLKACAKLVVKGDTLPPGKYENTTVDLSAAPGLGPMAVTHLKTKPIAGQKPGTSGVRKKTAVFMEGLYLHNFVQATLDAVKACGSDLTSQTLLVGGDGRYYNDVAIQTIVKIAVANGVKRVWVAKDGLASTPAVSALIREGGPMWKKVFGAFILTASHNPGGPTEDFGIKYNCENGGPAPEKLTDLIYANTCAISTVKIAEGVPAIDVSKLGETVVEARDGSCRACVEVVDGVSAHLDLLKTIFDMGAIQNLLNRPDFSICFDAMHGVTGPYAKALFCDQLGGGLKAVARSMPTSGAVDRVAEALNLALFETPTGWKFFGNLMDSKALFGGVDYTPFLCGEESFGTGSDHVREKDGLWAVLAWLSVLASYNGDASAPLVTVETIVKKHWATYGRNYYCRYDYEGVDKAEATKMMAKMTADAAANTGKVCGAYTIATADVFAYEDPVDGSVSKNQGVRFLMADGSASSSASRAPRAPARRDLAKFTGRESPTVIT